MVEKINSFLHNNNYENYSEYKKFISLYNFIELNMEPITQEEFYYYLPYMKTQFFAKINNSIVTIIILENQLNIYYFEEEDSKFSKFLKTKIELNEIKYNSYYMFLYFLLFLTISLSGGN
jgi:hypothetical protein